MTICYLIKLLPSDVLRGKSPFNVLYGQQPIYTHLWVLLVVFAIQQWLAYMDQFIARPVSAILMGYSPIQKGYTLLRIFNSTFFTYFPSSCLDG